MTRALAVMTDQHWGDYPDAAEPADLSPGTPPFCPKARAHMVRNLIRHRRRREQLFGAEVFADPVWDILLDLYASHHEGKNVAVTSLCIAAAVPPTTALRTEDLRAAGLRRTKPQPDEEQDPPAAPDER